MLTPEPILRLAFLSYICACSCSTCQGPRVGQHCAACIDWNEQRPK